MKIIVSNLSKTALLAVAYPILVMIISGVLMALGFKFPLMEISQATSLIQLIAAGTLAGGLATLLAVKGKGLTSLHFFTIIAFILFFSNLSVAIEGSLFTPGLITKPVLLTITIQQALTAILFGALALAVTRKNIAAGKAERSGQRRKINPLHLVALMTISSLVYIALYYTWGLINYNLFTEPFYEAGISGLSVPPTGILIRTLLFRGVLITITVMPFLLFYKPEGKMKMYMTGLILFVFGGIVPFMLVASLYPSDFIMYSLIEILLQNFLSGVIIYKLFNSRALQSLINNP